MKKLCAFLRLALCVSLAVPLVAAAQAYPTKVVRVIATFPAGTTVDVVMRLFTPKLAETYGQPFVIENRVGGAGNVGASYVAHAPADGYTLLAAAASIPSSISMYKNLDFDFVRDFEPIALLASSPFMLAVSPTVNVSTLPELISLAKSKPGVLNFSSSGVGGSNHLAHELMNSMAGIKMVHITYRSVAEALPGLVQGNVASMFLAIGQVMPLARAGRVKVVAVSSAQRTPLAPEIPTVAELGLPGFEAITWFALLAPAKTPNDIVTKLNASITKMTASKEIRDELTKIGAEPMSGTPQQAATFIKSEVVKWAKVVSDSGVKLE